VILTLAGAGSPIDRDIFKSQGSNRLALAVT